MLSYQGFFRAASGRQLPRYTAVGPDRQVEDLLLASPNILGVFLYEEGVDELPAGTTPAKVWVAAKEAYGDWKEKEIHSLFIRFTGKMADGSPIEQPGPLPVAAAAPSRSDARACTPPRVLKAKVGSGHCWMLLYSPTASHSAPGTVVKLPDDAFVQNEIAHRWLSGCLDPEVYVKVLAQKADELQEKIVESFKQHSPAPGAGGDPPGRGGASKFKSSHGEDDEEDDEAAGEDEDKATPDAAPVDVRILAVKFDEGDERWRTLADAAACMKEVDFMDWPLDGVRSAKFVVKTLKRNSKTFMSSHQEWVKNSGVRSNDRAVHEHRALSKMLELLTCYDQVNVTNLAGAEVAVKRRMLIEQAYEGRPDQPIWTGSEHMMGYKDTETGRIIDPEAVKYQAGKLKEESQVMKEARLKREEDTARHSGAGTGAGHGPAKK